MRVAGCGLWVSGFGFRVAGCGLRGAGCGVRGASRTFIPIRSLLISLTPDVANAEAGRNNHFPRPCHLFDLQRTWRRQVPAWGSGSLNSQGRVSLRVRLRWLCSNQTGWVIAKYPKVAVLISSSRVRFPWYRGKMYSGHRFSRRVLYCIVLYCIVLPWLLNKLIFFLLYQFIYFPSIFIVLVRNEIAEIVVDTAQIFKTILVRSYKLVLFKKKSKQG